MSENTEELKETGLHAEHLAAKGRMVPFAGYDLPVQYSGLTEEHNAVRNAVGLFDVSHMGEIEFTGEKAIEVANRIVSNNVSKLENGQACYSVMCRENGAIIDDLVVYRISDERVMICVNAANREKDFAWMKEQTKGDCTIEDRSEEYVQIAVQGPKAEELISRLTEIDLKPIKNYRFVLGAVAGVEGIIARTGYTGEDGFELYLPSAEGATVWRALLEKGEDLGVKPAGLGARDSLRLEFCFALYGNDITEDENPYEAGLGWVVKLKKKTPFVGQEALKALKAEGPKRKLTPIEITGRGIARPGYPVLVDGEAVGKVTSGTRSPSLGKAIALAYIPTEHTAEGTQLAVEVRGKPVEAVVVSRPFLKR